MADNSEEEKKELKPSRNRTRCSLNRSLPSLSLFPGQGCLGWGLAARTHQTLSFGLQHKPPAPAHPGAWCGLTQSGLLLPPQEKGSLPPSCCLLSLWPQGVLMLLKQRDAPDPPPACVGTWRHAGKEQVLCPGQTRFDHFPALRHLCSLLWALVSSVTSSQRRGSGSGRALQRVGCSVALPPAETSPG